MKGGGGGGFASAPAEELQKTSSEACSVSVNPVTPVVTCQMPVVRKQLVTCVLDGLQEVRGAVSLEVAQITAPLVWTGTDVAAGLASATATAVS